MCIKNIRFFKNYYENVFARSLTHSQIEADFINNNNIEIKKKIIITIIVFDSWIDIVKCSFKLVIAIAIETAY